VIGQVVSDRAAHKSLTDDGAPMPADSPTKNCGNVQMELLRTTTLRDRRAESHSWASCPVCNMRVDEWTATLMHDHQGRRYVFCSTRCAERFQENPVKYIKAA
jgi:YHS domain-containing protein